MAKKGNGNGNGNGKSMEGIYSFYSPFYDLNFWEGPGSRAPAGLQIPRSLRP